MKTIHLPGSVHHSSFVSRAEDNALMAQTASERHGGIDILCCNAGIFPAAKLFDMKESDLGSGSGCPRFPQSNRLSPTVSSRLRKNSVAREILALSG